MDHLSLDLSFLVPKMRTKCLCNISPTEKCWRRCLVLYFNNRSKSISAVSRLGKFLSGSLKFLEGHVPLDEGEISMHHASERAGKRQCWGDNHPNGKGFSRLISWGFDFVSSCSRAQNKDHWMK